LKKIISIFLTLLIVFNTGGYFFVYFQLSNCFKQIAFNKINDFIPLENLELIKLDLNAISSYDEDFYERVNDREISYCGKMYDIYKEEVSNDTLLIYCVSDENEDIINNAFDIYINDKKNDKPNSAIVNIIKIFITIALVQTEKENFNLKSNQIITNTYLISFQTIFIDVPSPPPRLA